MVEFRPLEPNPYIVGNPIRDRAMFFGRQEELRFLHDRLDTAGRELVVLCGGRRCGKTSILLQVLDGRLGERFLPVLVDMQQLAELHRDGDLWHAVARRILDRLGETGAGAAAPPVPAADDPEPHAAFRRFLDAVVPFLGTRKLVLLVDEYELLEEHVHRGTLTGDVNLALAALLDSTLPVSFLFTGSRRIQERDPAVWSRLMGRALHRRISFLALGDAERLIREPVRGRLEHSDDAVHAILRLTAGHPFYTQAFCQALVDRANERRAARIEVDDVDAAAETLADSPLPQMVYGWKSLPLLARVVASLLAAAADEPRTFVPAGAIEADLATHRREYGFTARRAAVRGTLERLLEEEDLETGDRRDAYRFRMDLIRRWLRVEHPVWEVLRELSAPGVDREGLRPLRAPRGGRRWALLGLAAALAAGAAVLALRWGGGTEPPRRDAARAAVAARDAGGRAPDAPLALADATATLPPAADAADAPPVPLELRYARRFALRRELPVPLGELAESDLAGRTDYFVFGYRAGRLVRFEHRNGAGFPLPDDAPGDDGWPRATTYEPEYRADGTVKRLAVSRCGRSGEHCAPLVVLLVGPDLRSRRAVLPGDAETPTWTADLVAAFVDESDAAGFATRTRSRNAFGKPQPDRLGRTSVETRRDPAGWPLELREELVAPFRLDADDLDDEDDGTARRTVLVEKTIYDERHDAREVAAFDGSGRPARFPPGTTWPGIHRVVREWDERDRPTLERYFGLADEPAALRGCTARRREYDEAGGLARETCLGPDDQPHADDDGVVRTEYEHDARGLPTVERLVGRDGQPAGDTVLRTWDDAGNEIAERRIDETVRDDDGRPLVLRARSFEYDAAGLVVAERVLDADGRPAAPAGFAVLRRERDAHGQVTAEHYEGPDGRPAATDADGLRGVAVASFDYDQAGFRIARRFADARGRPVDPPGQPAEVRWKIDTAGRTTERIVRPAARGGATPDGRWPGATRRVWDYDAAGNVIGERAYGADRAPAAASTGEFAVRRQFDALDRPTAEWYLDTDGHPLAGGPDGVPRRTWTYAALGPGDACWSAPDGAVRCGDPQGGEGGPRRGTVRELRFLDADGRPTWSVAQGPGVVRVVDVTDDDGRLLERRTFGADDRPLANRRGWAALLRRWSPAGPIEESYLGADGVPVEVEWGGGLRCARRTWTYDERGREVEYRTLGADGAPRADAAGVASRLRRYDGDGLVEERYLGADGALHAGPLGIARATWDYDAAGHPVREAFFGADGAAVAPPGWVAELTAAWDDAGRPVRFEPRPALAFGTAGELLAAVEIAYRGADVLAVPRNAAGRHLLVAGLSAFRRSRAEWGEAAGCIGVDGQRLDCPAGAELLSIFLDADRTVSCSSDGAGAGDGRCTWVGLPGRALDPTEPPGR